MPQKNPPTRPSGRFQVMSRVGGEEVRAFFPSPLPLPTDELDLTELQADLGEANRALGALDAISSLLPSTGLFVYMFVRKEAVLSSQIEGTQSTLDELLQAESMEGAPRSDDLTETSAYVSALERGTELVRDGWPLTSRMFDELHRLLLGSGRGSERLVGEYRRGQNWVGGTRPGNAAYVPPPPETVAECMGDLERFVNAEPAGESTLVRAGLAHALFETIHPYGDGNGRLGRMLVPLMLLREKTLSDPLLYISLFLKEHRERYYDLLQRTRTESAWTEWIRFFLEGVTASAHSAVGTASDLTRLFERDRVRIRTERDRPGSVLQVHEVFQTHPVRSLPDVVERAALSYPTVSRAIEIMEELGMVIEVTGRKRDRIFVYDEYIKTVSKERTL
ncbi:MAG: Fic family protein [Planctomycetota bacterium]